MAPLSSSRRKVSAALRLGLASGISAACLWALLRHVDVRAVAARMKQVQWPGLLGYLCALMVTQVCRAWRWRTLLLPLAPVTPSSAWRMSNVGNMWIMLLPLRLGELSRPVMLKREWHAPLSAGLGAALVERVLDGLLVTLLFFATTALMPAGYRVPKPLWAGASLALTLFAGAVVAIFATLLAHDAFVRLLRRFAYGRARRPMEQAILLIEAFVVGMRALPNLGAIVSVLGATITYWGANALGMVALMHAFGWALPWVSGATLVCVLVIGVMIPAGPGLLGTYQAALVAALGVYRVGYEDAVAFSMVAYLGNLGVLVACGAPPLLFNKGAPGARSTHGK